MSLKNWLIVKPKNTDSDHDSAENGTDKMETSNEPQASLSGQVYCTRNPNSVANFDIGQDFSNIGSIDDHQKEAILTNRFKPQKCTCNTLVIH